MKFRIPKNRIVPLIILAILAMFTASMFGLRHVLMMAEYSYQTTNRTYDSLADNTAALIRQNIENNYQSIKVSANLVGQEGKLDKEKIVSILPLISEKKSYIDLAIVDLDGKGYNMKGEEVNASGKLYFVNAKYGEVNISENLSYTEDGEPIMVYAAPIIKNNKCIGVLLAEISAKINVFTYMLDKELGSCQLYLLNKNYDLIAYSENSKKDNFYYKRTINNGYLYDKNNKKGKEVTLMNFFYAASKKDKNFVWYQKDILMNGWTVLIGREDKMDPITQNILLQTFRMWAFIMSSMLILFLMLIIFQSRSNRKLLRMLYLDPVTGGYNWYKFRIVVGKILNSRQFNKKRYALVNFDINRFKLINDAYGLQKGDEVLKNVYNVLRKWVKRDEPLTRYAADQFFVLISFQDMNEVTFRINDLNDRLHQIINNKTMKFFFGVYFITERLDSIDRMGDFAGTAKNKIKGNSEDNISFFDDESRNRIIEEENIEKNMHDALVNNEFLVYLQPKYSIREEVMSGAEALVRWANKEGKLVSPGYFIPVFEKNGFIVELDNYMLRKVCEILKRWLEHGINPAPISVNVSRIQFADPNLADHICDIVDQYQIPHQLIELELTESAFLQNKEIMVNTVIRMREYGFMVSMDDFGAGYSSLNSLKDLPLDVVKLDGEMLRETQEEERGHTVIRSTISMAKDLHMKVVAECIETQKQVDFLYDVGCDLIQGYFYAKPMPVEQFERQYYQAVE